MKVGVEVGVDEGVEVCVGVMVGGTIVHSRTNMSGQLSSNEPSLSVSQNAFVSPSTRLEA